MNPARIVIISLMLIIVAVLIWYLLSDIIKPDNSDGGGGGDSDSGDSDSGDSDSGDSDSGDSDSDDVSGGTTNPPQGTSISTSKAPCGPGIGPCVTGYCNVNKNKCDPEYNSDNNPETMWPYNSSKDGTRYFTRNLTSDYLSGAFNFHKTRGDKGQYYEIRNADTKQCVDILKNNHVGTRECDGDKTTQVWSIEHPNRIISMDNPGKYIDGQDLHKINRCIPNTSNDGSWSQGGSLTTCNENQSHSNYPDINPAS